jgi:hypothetical protein
MGGKQAKERRRVPADSRHQVQVALIWAVTERIAVYRFNGQGEPQL